MGFDFFQQAQLFNIFNDPFTRLKSVQAAVGLWRVIINRSVNREYIDYRQVVTLADFIVIKVMSRGYLYAARSEFRIDVFIGYDRNTPVAER